MRYLAPTITRQRLLGPDGNAVASTRENFATTDIGLDGTLTMANRESRGAITVRAATDEDGPALTTLVRTSAAYDGPYRVMVANQTLGTDYLRANLVRVAEDGDQIAGFYSLLVPGRGQAGEGELDFMFVAEHQQGRRIGRLLADDLRREATGQGLRRVLVVSHPPAEGFYRAAGLGSSTRYRRPGASHGRAPYWSWTSTRTLEM